MAAPSEVLFHSRFPVEVDHMILSYLGQQPTFLSGRFVCKNWKRAIDGFIAAEWEKVKNLSFEGLVLLKDRTKWIEKSCPNDLYIIRFKRLSKSFKERYGVEISSTKFATSVLQIQSLFPMAQKNEEEAIVILWK